MLQYGYGILYEFKYCVEKQRNNKYTFDELTELLRGKLGREDLYDFRTEVIKDRKWGFFSLKSDIMLSEIAGFANDMWKVRYQDDLPAYFDSEPDKKLTDKIIRQLKKAKSNDDVMKVAYNEDYYEYFACFEKYFDDIFIDPEHDSIRINPRVIIFSYEGKIMLECEALLLMATKYLKSQLQKYQLARTICLGYTNADSDEDRER